MKSIKQKIKKVIKFILTIFSPKLASKILFYKAKNKKLDLKRPVWFNEKLMWIKLYELNKDKNVWKCADKYYMRQYAKDKGVDKENLTTLIGVYNNVEEIKFDSLPNKFVLKCSHGCGFNIICTDKDKLDISNSKNKIRKWMNTKFGYETAELHYTHIKPHIICEKFIEDNSGEFPIDYKIYCFNGIPKIILVCVDRKKGYQTAFYDMNWKRIHLRYNETDKEIKKPKSFDKMIEISKKLSKDFKFVRVDLYEWNEKPILGEMTFTPAACLGEYTVEAEKILGDMLSIE